jgi:hypothetical protein
MWDDDGAAAMMETTETDFHSVGFDGEPAMGAGVKVETIETGERQVVNYFFPVEVIVEGKLAEGQLERIEQRIFASLTNALERIA